MLRLSAPVLSVLVVFVACNDGGGGDHPTTDARKIDGNGTTETTSCANPIPTAATDTVVISGVTSDGSFSGSGQPLIGATLDAFRTGSASLGTTTSESGGIYQLTATTNGMPIDYLLITKSGYEPARFYPRVPIAKGTSMPKFPLFTTGDATGFPAQFGVTQDAGKGMAIIYVINCQATPIANATVTVGGSGAVVKYLHSDMSTTGTATDATGLAVVFNLAGSTLINAHMGATDLHEHAIVGDPAFLTMAAISEQ